MVGDFFRPAGARLLDEAAQEARPMRAQKVAALLRTLGLPDTMNPYGFAISKNYRLECGSGIAGRTEQWRIVHIPTGWIFAHQCRYKRELEPVLKQWIKENHEES